MSLTASQLCRIFDCGVARAAAYVDYFNDAMQAFEINTPARQAMFLAQVGQESGGLRYVEELADGSAYTGRADLGNTKPDAYHWAGSVLPGPWFKGHGLMQVTGYDAHQAVGQYLHPDDPTIFLREPLALCRPRDAVRSACWVWAVFKNLNPLADAGDFRGTTIRINGGLNGQPNRLLLLAKAEAELAGQNGPVAPSPAIPAPEPVEGAAGAAIGPDDVAAALKSVGDGDA